MRYIDMLTILDKFLDKVERHNKIVEELKAKTKGGKQGKAKHSGKRK